MSGAVLRAPAGRFLLLLLGVVSTLWASLHVQASSSAPRSTSATLVLARAKLTGLSFGRQGFKPDDLRVQLLADFRLLDRYANASPDSWIGVFVVPIGEPFDLGDPATANLSAVIAERVPPALTLGANYLVVIEWSSGGRRLAGITPDAPDARRAFLRQHAQTILDAAERQIFLRELESQRGSLPRSAARIGEPSPSPEARAALVASLWKQVEVAKGTLTMAAETRAMLLRIRFDLEPAEQAAIDRLTSIGTAAAAALEATIEEVGRQLPDAREH